MMAKKDGVKIISSCSPPGGAGKTTVSVGLACSLADQGERVLFVDLDDNNNGTDWALRKTSPEVIEDRNVFHVLTGKRSLDEVVFSSPLGFDVVPAAPSLYRLQEEFEDQAEVDLTGTIQDLRNLQAAARSEFIGMLDAALGDYDFIVIDSPPGLSFASTVAVCAADIVVMPLRMVRKQITAYEILWQFAARFRTNSVPIVSVPNCIQSAQEDEAVRRFAAGQGLSGVSIPKNESIQAAMENGEAFGIRARRARESFRALTKELLEKQVVTNVS